jgi:hypothetical protein
MVKIACALSVVAVLALSACSGGIDMVSNVGTTTATFNAHGDCDGGSPTPCEWAWRYRKTGTTAWTEVGPRPGVCGWAAVELHAVPVFVEGHVKQGTYGCQGGTATSGGDLFTFKLAGGQVCAPVFKDQGGTGTLSNGMPAGMTQGRYSVRFRVRNGRSAITRSRGCCGRTATCGRTARSTSRRSRSFPGDGARRSRIIRAERRDRPGRVFKSGVTAGSDNAWHVATIERTASSVKYLLDGQTVGTSTSGLPSQAMHWVLQSETTNSTSVPPSRRRPSLTLTGPPRRARTTNDRDGKSTG